MKLIFGTVACCVQITWTSKVRANVTDPVRKNQSVDKYFTCIMVIFTDGYMCYNIVVSPCKTKKMSTRYK